MKILPAICLELALTGFAQTAVAQEHVDRSHSAAIVSEVGLTLSASSMAMPRVYFSSPEATVGWKARYHYSLLAPAMTLTALTWLVDSPIRNALESTRPGCSKNYTLARIEGSGCESFGGPSTQAFASAGFAGISVAVFAVDAIQNSQGKIHWPAFLGSAALPTAATIVTSVARGVSGRDTEAHETAGQILLGALPGYLTGIVLGATYATLSPPHCGYGNNLFCF